MIRNALRYFLTIAALMLTVAVHGQQQAMFTQYMFNGLVINPAYAGSQETFTAAALFRKQWVGITDAPETQTFSAHSPLDKLRYRKRPGSKVSLGITLFNDRVAITNQTGVFAAYAYRLRLANNASFAMGLQAGFSQMRIKYSALELDDPSFLTGDIAEWVPNFGAGVYYNTQRFYTGLSAPHLVHKSWDQQTTSVALIPQYFLTMGYVLDLSSQMKLKPNILVKRMKGHPVQLDVNCNLFLSPVIELGVSWRSLESISSMLRLQVHSRFAFGYAYDMPSGSELSRLSNGSHEMMITYRSPVKKLKTVNPRYF
jgi:type IX secretion system PorP/SprF family membrane protein